MVLNSLCFRSKTSKAFKKSMNGQLNSASTTRIVKKYCRIPYSFESV
uniref:Uncharacterized protein n=1 Tax=Utricularia reniformis TaxID=192314 RepID=A0A1Y0B2P2_9LAMI|nr:hypothetical protein AEK19_MT1425 [Utricularia reniformis]ART31619.1 hypothetical protein AEK19_MT1425 [Utricularia reniformis]